MGTEDQILKGTKLITNTKKQRLKIQRLDSQKYNIKNTKQNQSQKLKKKINHKNYKKYEICIKNRVSFFAR